MLSRAVVNSARVVTPRRAGAVIASRAYTENVGRATHSKGFSEKEKAQEDLFIYEREKARAKQLREEIEKHQKELAELEKKEKK